MTGNPDVGGIFGPGRIGSMTLRNRLVLPAMGTNLGTEEGYVTDRLKNYHRARAKGGVGLSINGNRDTYHFSESLLYA
jgi:2,4-dienoyl-CoA reductase-like NADH-dependent reductase (Old Yellow Enzyme family)